MLKGNLRSVAFGKGCAEAMSMKQQPAGACRCFRLWDTATCKMQSLLHKVEESLE